MDLGAPVVELLRLEESDQGTIGVLRIQKQFYCCTLEPPDLENQVNVSSIPAQSYNVGRYNSPTHGNTFRVENVPGRSFILFHAGNTVEQTAGCILLGSRVGKFRGSHDERAILNSGDTFKKFMALMDGVSNFTLVIKEEY